MLLVDLSYAVNTIVPHRLVNKLGKLSHFAHGLWTVACKPQKVRIGDCISSIFILNARVPQGCILSPLFLFSLFTHEFTLKH